MNYFNYFTDIEETFIRRRGKHLLLSPLDWALIESWQERGIPLRIVLRGIETVFDGVDKNPNHTRTIKSLTYCREEIETQYAQWRESQIGKAKEKEKPQNKEKRKEKKKNIEPKNESTLFSDETIINHLKNVTESLNQAKAKAEGELRQTLEKVLEKLSDKKTAKKDAESLEEFLNDLESLIDKTLLKTTNEKSLAKTKKDVAKDLSKYKANMKQDVYQRTFDLMLLKHLREQAEIPRLSLFYL